MVVVVVPLTLNDQQVQRGWERLFDLLRSVPCRPTVCTGGGLVLVERSVKEHSEVVGNVAMVDNDQRPRTRQEFVLK